MPGEGEAAEVVELEDMICGIGPQIKPCSDTKLRFRK